MIDLIKKEIEEQENDIIDYVQSRFDLDGLSYKWISIDIDTIDKNNLEHFTQTIKKHLDSDVENSAYDVWMLDGMKLIYNVINNNGKTNNWGFRK